MLSEQSNLWAFLTKDCGISDAELKTLTHYQIEEMCIRDSNILPSSFPLFLFKRKSAV